MNTETNEGTLDALVQDKISGDTEFQTSLESMSDDDKASAIETKTSELRETSFKELNEKNTKNVELAGNYKTRAEKAEKGNKEVKTEGEGDTTPKNEGDLSTTDLYAMTEAKVPLEDIEEVKRIANILGKPIAEALKDEIMVSKLKQLSEHRTTADATNTEGAKPVSNQVTDAQIVEDAENGKVPEKGSPEAERLFWIRKGGKPKN